MINGKHGQGLTVPKWVLINCLKIPQLPHNLFAQIVCPSPNVWDFDEKMLHWVSVVRGLHNFASNILHNCLFMIISFQGRDTKLDRFINKNKTKPCDFTRILNQFWTEQSTSYIHYIFLKLANTYSCTLGYKVIPNFLYQRCT